MSKRVQSVYMCIICACVYVSVCKHVCICARVRVHVRVFVCMCVVAQFESDVVVTSPICLLSCFYRCLLVT